MKYCKLISVSFKITIQILEEYLKSKILSDYNFDILSRIRFKFSPDIPIKKKCKESLNELYTLEDIALINNQKKKKNLNFKYKITFVDEEAFNEILSKVPNKSFLSHKIIKNFTRKIQKRKQEKGLNDVYKCQRSIFSLINNSNLGDFNDQNKSLNNFQDSFNFEKHQNLNSINFDDSHKNSLSYLKFTNNKVSNNNHKIDSNINFSNFNMSNIINVNNISVKVDSKGINGMILSEEKINNKNINFQNYSNFPNAKEIKKEEKKKEENVLESFTERKKAKTEYNKEKNEIKERPQNEFNFEKGILTKNEIKIKKDIKNDQKDIKLEYSNYATNLKNSALKKSNIKFKTFNEKTFKKISFENLNDELKETKINNFVENTPNNTEEIESLHTKNSKNYDEGLMNLLKQIKNLEK